MKKDNISIFSLLDDEGIKTLCDCLKSTFLRMGIVKVDFEISEKEIYDGSLLIKAISTPFNTTPVMFREVRVECEGRLHKCEKDDWYELDMSCDYNYNLFRGGSNGSTFGMVHFHIFKGKECRAIYVRFEFDAETRRIDL